MIRIIIAGISAILLLSLSLNLSACKPGLYYSFKPHAQQETQQQAQAQWQAKQQQKQEQKQQVTD